MPLSAQDAFKVGFLARCVEAGLDADQTLAAVKRAGDLFEKQAFLGNLISTTAGKVMDVGKGALGATAAYGLPLAVAAPPILGGLTGYGLARATDVDDTDVAAIKDQEVVDELRRQAARLRRERAVRDFRQANRGVSARPLM